MLGVGWTEMLVIGIVALVVIGPKELPTVMNRIGKFAATIRRMGTDFQRELNKTTGLNEIANLRNSVTAPLKATADAIRKEFNTTTATGEVKPSGAIKPADPKAESVVDEIKAAAGIAPAAMTPLTGPANPITPAVSTKPAESVKPAAAVKPAISAESPAPPETKPARVRAAKVPKVSAPPADMPVAVADIPPASKASARAKKPIESPAPVEAIAPTPKLRARKPATPVAAAPAPVAEAAPKKKPAARKPAADKKL
jgi:sec-independent protein translocase protein TatB